MKKNIFLIILFSFSFLFAENKNLKTEINSELEIFSKNNYLEESQWKMVTFIENIQDYRNNIELIDTLKEIIILTKNQDIKEKAILLYNDNVFNNEKKIINNKGEEKIKIINTLPFEKKFYLIKEKLSNSYKDVQFLYAINKKEDSENLFNLLNENKKSLKEEEIFYKIDFFIKTGNKEEANNIFTNFIEKNFEKKFKENINNIRIKPSIETILGDIYSLGAYLNYNNKELFDLYKSRSYFFYKENTIRFDYIMANNLKLEESYIESATFYENLSLKNKNFNNELLEVYLSASKKSYFNNKYDISWVNARKGLLIQSEVLKNKEFKQKNTLLLIELKKYLKESSLYYIQSLIEKGEHAHSSRIQKETLTLLSKRIN
jgi:hypothetical protein